MLRSLNHLLYRIGVRPKWPGSPPRIETATEVRPCCTDPSYKIGIIRIAGTVPSDGNGAAQGRLLARLIPNSEVDAVVVDLSQVQCAPLPGWNEALASGLWVSRARFVLPASWPRDNAMHFPASVQEAIAAIEMKQYQTLRDARLTRALDLTRVILRGGLGAIRFGMSVDQVEKLLGSPDHTEIIFGENVLEYYGPKLRLTFRDIPDRGWSLVTISAVNCKLYLQGIPLLDVDELSTTHAIASLGVVETKTQRHRGTYFIEFTHGLTLYGAKGPPHEAIWTILPESDRTEGIDWSNANCIG